MLVDRVCPIYDHIIINTNRHYPSLGTLPALCTSLTFYMLAVWSQPRNKLGSSKQQQSE